MLTKKLALLAAASLVIGSSAAVAQTAQPLSLANSPSIASASATGEASDLSSRGAGIYIIGAIALGLIIWGIIEITDGDDGPTSP